MKVNGLDGVADAVGVVAPNAKPVPVDAGPNGEGLAGVVADAGWPKELLCEICGAPKPNGAEVAEGVAGELNEKGVAAGAAVFSAGF